MRIWSVKFSGIWPVGAVAIVCTPDSLTEGMPLARAKESAEHLLRTKLNAVYPRLYPEPIEATLLDIEPGSVHVLLDGDY